jgi:hypothetical protein
MFNDFLGKMGELVIAQSRIGAISSLASFSGMGPPHETVQYFANFELMTTGWQEGEKASLLINKLVGRAKTLFQSIPPQSMNNYREIKDFLFKKLVNNDISKDLAHQRFLEGEPRGFNEGIEKYSVRVEQLVRTAFPGCTQEDTFDICKSYFLKNLNDRRIAEMLAPWKKETGWHGLVNKAVEIQSQMRNSGKQRGPVDSVNRGTDFQSGFQQNSPPIVNYTGDGRQQGPRQQPYYPPNFNQGRSNGGNTGENTYQRYPPPSKFGSTTIFRPK